MCILFLCSGYNPFQSTGGLADYNLKKQNTEANANCTQSHNNSPPDSCNLQHESGHVLIYQSQERFPTYNVQFLWVVCNSLDNEMTLHLLFDKLLKSLW